MWGWKTIERVVETNADLNAAQMILCDRGYEVVAENEGVMFMIKSGTQYTMKGEKLPFELAVASVPTGLFLQARYGAFVLFDTGDLEKHLQAVIADIETANG